MYSIDHMDYSPFLRGKSGEFLGLEKLRDQIKARIVPTIILPSLSIKDMEKRRVLNKREAPRTFIKRIAGSWKKRPFFIESRFIKFDPDPNKDAATLHAMLELCEQHDCKAIPVIDLRTPEPRLQIYKDYIATTQSGAAFRITLGDLTRPGLESRVPQVLSTTGLSLDQAALLIELAGATIVDKKAFAELILMSFLKLSEVGHWSKIVIASSNFPKTNPATKNNHAVVPRLEWGAWQEAARSDERLKLSVFGDFGADNGKIEFSEGGGAAIIHLRYATSENWLIPRGGPTTDKIDGSIRFVAARIVNNSYFAGDRFSWGDEFIADCANNACSPGSPTTWRAVNMNHHITRVVVDIEHFYGRDIPESHERLTPAQQPLLL